MTKREILASIIKYWAKNHHTGYQIAVDGDTDESVLKTGSHLSWVLQKHQDISLDLLKLLNSIDTFIKTSEASRKAGGCSCIKCKSFAPMAEPNQINGTFICYSCRK